MKLINNQDTLLIDEVKNLINQNSKVYVSCNYFTAFAVFELIDILKKSSQVNILLDFNSEILSY